MICRTHPYMDKRWRHDALTSVKEQAHGRRRMQERVMIQTVQDWDAAVIPNKNQEVSDIWNWD